MTSSSGPPRASAAPSFHFVAGASSGVLSAVLLQPADLLKTRLQQSHSTALLPTIRAIAAGPRPIRSFWRGTAASALRTGFGSALYFTSLHSLRQHFALSSSSNGRNNNTSGGDNDDDDRKKRRSRHSSVLPPLPPLANLAVGAAARAAAGFVLMPVTVLKVRYESTLFSYGSLASAARDVLRTEGARGFFAGFGATAVRDAPYAGLYVVFYEAGKSRLSGLLNDGAGHSLRHGDMNEKKVAGSAEAGTVVGETGSSVVRGMSASMSSSINFSSGVLAAGLATALTNPFDAVKTRLQLVPTKYRHMTQAARLMLREEGVGCMFDGLALRMARKAVSSALAWTVYEELIRRAEVEWRTWGRL